MMMMMMMMNLMMIMMLFTIIIIIIMMTMIMMTMIANEGFFCLFINISFHKINHYDDDELFNQDI